MSDNRPKVLKEFLDSALNYVLHSGKRASVCFCTMPAINLLFDAAYKANRLEIGVPLKIYGVGIEYRSDITSFLGEDKVAWMFIAPTPENFPKKPVDFA